MSEMTIEKAKDILSDVAHGRIVSSIQNVQAFDMAIKALEENEKLKEELEKLFHQSLDIDNQAQEKIKSLNETISCVELQVSSLQNSIINYSIENRKLKKECNEYRNRIIKTEKDAQAEIARLNEEIDFLQRKSDAQGEMISHRLDEKFGMSAVEVLEWLRNSEYKEYSTIIGYVVDSDSGYTPQEIVDKITEYKNKNHIADNRKMVEPHLEPMTHNNCRWKNRSRTELPCVDCLEYDKWEPMTDNQKADNSQVEWVWQCFTEEESIYICQTELEAIKWCEYVMTKYPHDFVWYRKVYRRKE